MALSLLQEEEREEGKRQEEEAFCELVMGFRWGLALSNAGRMWVWGKGEGVEPVALPARVVHVHAFWQDGAALLADGRIFVASGRRDMASAGAWKPHDPASGKCREAVAGLLP